MLDVAGLCLAARHTDYVGAVKRALDAGGPCTAIGHAETFRAEDAALINGTAAHGEDFDDTFEGGPVHSGAVVVPAVLAACERFGRDGAAARLGIAVGVETLCRLALVRPKAIHDAGFHPDRVLGTFAATAGVGAALGLLAARRLVDALGIAGQPDRRHHRVPRRRRVDQAPARGRRGARRPPGGAPGRGTVQRSAHRASKACTACSARSRTMPHGDFDALTEGFGERWHLLELTFKPYATGTMNQPYVDCARRLAAQGRARRGHRRDRLRDRERIRRAPVGAARATSTARRTPTPRSSRRRSTLPSRFVLRRRRARRVQRRDRARSAPPRARGQGALRRRPGQSVSARATPATCA